MNKLVVILVRVAMFVLAFVGLKYLGAPGWAAAGFAVCIANTAIPFPAESK